MPILLEDNHTVGDSTGIVKNLIIIIIIVIITTILK